jgi:fibronectin type 3 domain-containing protein
VSDAIAVAGTGQHSCALLADGTEQCWGSNIAGQLGDGTNTGPQTCNGSPCSLTPVTVTGLSGATAIAGGDQDSCALVTTGTGAECWGANFLGQLGDGTTTDSSVPVSVSDGGTSVPAAPIRVIATRGETQASVAWTPSIDNGAAVTGYLVTASPGGASAFGDLVTNRATLTGLTGGITYTFSVHAITLDGISAESLPSNPVTPTGPPGPPTAPLATPGNTTAAISWTPPSASGSSPVDGYVVTPYLGGIAHPELAFDTTSTSATMTGVANGQSFQFTVTATNADGSGPASALSEPVIIGVPAEPLVPRATSGNARAAITWSAPNAQGSAITGYVVTSFLAPGHPNTTQTFSSTATTQVVTGLTNGVAYTFAVSAINAFGTSAPSPYSQAVTIGTPAAPTGARATPATANTATGSLTVTYAAGANNGAPITKFTATCSSTNGGIANTATHTGSTATPLTVGGLTTKKTYTCTVKASNSRGFGQISVASRPTIIGAPAAPTAIHVTKVAPGSLKVTFTEPTNNGATITSYTVACISTNGGATKNKTGTGASITVTALTAGKTYTCTVTATNSRGKGPTSVPSTPLNA